MQISKNALFCLFIVLRTRKQHLWLLRRDAKPQTGGAGGMLSQAI